MSIAETETQRFPNAERHYRKGSWKTLFGWNAVMVATLALMAAVAWLEVPRTKPGRPVSTMGNEHIGSEWAQRSIDYNSAPPTSGPHVDKIARWGIHTGYVPDKVQLHNLEHGGVIVQYYCEDCDDMVNQLATIVRRYPDHVILAPYPIMKSRIALTAWGRIDTFDEFNEIRIVAFIEAFAGLEHHVRES